MKKVLSVLLVIALCLSMLCACSKEAEKGGTENTAENTASDVSGEAENNGNNSGNILNPIQSVTQDELANRTGLDLAAPEGAEDVQWFIVNTGDPAIAQLDFTYDDVSYSYRAQPTGELTSYDMAGLYYTWTDTKASFVGSCEATVSTCADAGFVSWLDIAPGINYNLSSVETGDGVKLVEIANLVFKSVQGNADGDEDMPGEFVDYAGSYSDSAETGADTVSFTANDKNGYDVEINLTRLANLTGVGYVMDGAVEMELDDPSGGLIYGIFYPAEDGTYTLMFTQSDWSLLETGTTFEGFTADAAEA